MKTSADRPLATSTHWDFFCIKHSPNEREYVLRNQKHPFPLLARFLWLLTALQGVLLLLGRSSSSASSSSLGFWLFVVTLLLALAKTYFRITSVSEERLLVMRDLGVQLTTKLYSGAQSRQFIEKELLESVFINEGLVTYQILYYLALKLKGHNRLVLPFQVPFCCFLVVLCFVVLTQGTNVKHACPRLRVLLPIYKGTRALLYGDDDEREEGDERGREKEEEKEEEEKNRNRRHVDT
ncbi:hypothetical protein QOT17_008372 [Balamuthia mandrillaris]